MKKIFENKKRKVFKATEKDVELAAVIVGGLRASIEASIEKTKKWARQAPLSPKQLAEMAGDLTGEVQTVLLKEIFGEEMTELAKYLFFHIENESEKMH